MPSFSLNDGWYQVAYIWGPGHALVSLRINDTPEADPEVVRLDPIGGCDHGTFDIGRLKSVIVEAIHEANGRLGTMYGCEAIRYVSNDSPDYRWYARGAREIVERLAEDGYWHSGNHPNPEHIRESSVRFREDLLAGGALAEHALKNAPDLFKRCRTTAIELARRLTDLGYPRAVVIDPPQDVDALIASLEDAIREFIEPETALVPPALAALWRIVGSISFVEFSGNGDGYTHCRFWQDRGIEGPNGFSDALHIDGISEEWIDMVREDFREHRDWMAENPEPTGIPEGHGGFVMSLSPDGYHKDNISGGPAYGVWPGSDWDPIWREFRWAGGAVPMSAPEGAPTLIEYLRTTILECAGFPGLFGVPEFESVRLELLSGLPPF